MTDTVTLEPCPFCGKEGWLFKHSSAYTDEYSVRCENGCCEVCDEYEAEAIALWNTRPLAMRSASPVDGEVVERVREAISNAAWEAMRAQGFSGGWDHDEFAKAVADAALTAMKGNDRG